MAEARAGFAIEIDQWLEPARLAPMIATINGNPSAPARANDAGVPPTPTRWAVGFC